MSPAYIFTKQGVSIMGLKSKDTQQIQFEDLEFEAEYEEERTYTTISGKEENDVHEWDGMKSYELDVGDEMEGIPEIVIFENKDKKYDSLRLRVLDDGEYLDCYVNIPKRDKLGYISNIRKTFDFYRTCFDFIFSILRIRDERNVVNKDGEEVNRFKTVNLETFAKYVDSMTRVGVRVTEGNPDSDYNSWEIYKME